MEFTRRTFLKGAGAAVAVTALPSLIPAGYTAYEEVYVGNVGFRMFPEMQDHIASGMGWDPAKTEWRYDGQTGDWIGRHHL